MALEIESLVQTVTKTCKRNFGVFFAWSWWIFNRVNFSLWSIYLLLCHSICPSVCLSRSRKKENEYQSSSRQSVLFKIKNEYETNGNSREVYMLIMVPFGRRWKGFIVAFVDSSTFYNIFVAHIQWWIKDRTKREKNDEREKKYFFDRLVQSSSWVASGEILFFFFSFIRFTGFSHICQIFIFFLEQMHRNKEFSSPGYVFLLLPMIRSFTIRDTHRETERKWLFLRFHFC